MGLFLTIVNGFQPLKELHVKSFWRLRSTFVSGICNILSTLWVKFNKKKRWKFYMIINRNELELKNSYTYLRRRKLWFIFINEKEADPWDVMRCSQEHKLFLEFNSDQCCFDDISKILEKCKEWVSSLQFQWIINFIGHVFQGFHQHHTSSARRLIFADINFWNLFLRMKLYHI